MKYPNAAETKDLIKRLVKDYKDGVICFLSNDNEVPSRGDHQSAVVFVRDGSYVDLDFNVWKYATPVESNFGIRILGYEDGKLILED